MTAPAWHVFTGNGDPHDGWANVPPPMIARTFGGGPVLAAPRTQDAGSRRRLGAEGIGAHQLGPGNLDVINAAIFCRRPLLVTGAPGLGKTSLAYLIARELKLGPVLSWPITSRTTLQDGLYHYDALRRFEEARLPLAVAAAAADTAAATNPGTNPGTAAATDADAERGAEAPVADVADYLTLGPLGTALLPWDRPRVLLVDEIDKADVDLPNDLLHVFEDGEFQIPELRRMRVHRPTMRIATHNDGERVDVREGLVGCSAFPIVIMTSNGERDFPPAFLRRCLRLSLDAPGREQLESVVTAHLGLAAVNEYGDVIDAFLRRRSELGALPADRLLIAIHIIREAGRGGDRLSREDRAALARQLMQPLEPTG